MCPQVQAAPIRCRLSKKMDGDEKFYGLGDKTGFFE